MKQKKEILMISHAYIKKINTSFCQILSHKYNFNVSLVCPKEFKDKNIIYPDYVNLNYVKNLFFLETKFSHLRLMYYKKLFFILRKKNFSHIILDLDPVSLQSIILIFYSFLFKFKISYFSNENTILENNKKIKHKIKIFFVKVVSHLIRKKVFKIFCYTNQIKENLKHIGYTSNVVICPLGYNHKIFFKKYKKKSKIFTISYFGRIEPEKGIHNLLVALNKINIKKFIFFLDIYHLNNLSYFKTIKKDLKLLLKKKQLKLIKPNYENISTIMGETDLTVLPSEYNEQYGRVLQEAAACGSLVIGSNIGAIPEIIFKRDFIFKPKNVSDLKNIIEKIYYNKKKYSSKFFPVYKHIIHNRTILNQANILYSHLY
jgi:glycosyltransferase involved in cell wall biosynthesis